MRDDVLRRILESTVDTRALGEDRTREILAHLEDSMEAKLRDGLPETEALARALEEFGDLRQAAGRGAPLLVTPEGATFRGGFSRALLLYVNVLLFVAFELIVTRKFTGILGGMNLELPTPYMFFEAIASALSANGAATALGLAGLGVALFALARTRWMARAWNWLALGLGLLLIAAFFSVVLPMMSALEGIAR